MEVCKTSGVNFATMCNTNINMAIKDLYQQKKISKEGTYKDGTYFTLSTAERTLVDKMAEEICLSMRFLSLSCNEIHS